MIARITRYVETILKTECSDEDFCSARTGTDANTDLQFGLSFLASSFSASTLTSPQSFCFHSGDLSNPKIKAGKEGAFNATIEWFQAKL